MSGGRRYRRQVQRGALLVLPGIPDGAEPALKNALAIRNAASSTGLCPKCGALLELDRPLEPGTIVHGRMAHEDWCPAGDDRLRELVARSGEAS